MLKNINRKGTWVEYTAEGLAELPVLGISNSDKSGEKGVIGTFTRGMILSIDKGSFKKGENTIFHRLFAPSSAHTTQRVGRSCVSCHNDPVALGYGRGKLIFSKEGKWSFDPAYEITKYDGLPEDAWTGFLQERKNQAATRKNMRPFNLAEQKRILMAGACLTCHSGNSLVMKQCLNDFDLAIKRMTRSCRGMN
jgi:hypothetical protein